MADSGRAGQDLSSDPTRTLAALDEVSSAVVLLEPVRDGGELVDFVFAYVNRRAGKIAEMPAPELRGRRLCEALPAFPPRLFAAFATTLAGGEPFQTVFDYSDALAGRPGFSVRFDVAVSRLGDALLIVYDDVAARARARSAERRFGAVLDATSDWVSIADPELNLVYINEGGRRMVGIGLDEDIEGAADRRVLAAVGARPRAQRRAAGGAPRRRLARRGRAHAPRGLRDSRSRR